MTIAIVVTALLIANVLPTVASALLARALGLAVPRVDLGVWRPRLRSDIGGTAVTLTPWQLSSSYLLKDAANRDDYPETPGRLFDSVPPLVRALVIVTGPLLLLLATVPALGMEAFTAFAAGFGQIVAGALSPFGEAQALLAGFRETAAATPVRSVAIVVSKLAAFALLPIPPQPGGNALLQLLRGRRLETPGWFGTVQLVGLLAVLAIAASWVAAGAHALL